MIKICEKYFVGFNRRSTDDSEKFLLAYVAKDSSLSSFQSWRDKHIAIKEIDNTPKIGWKLFGSTRRSRDWFGSGRSMIYVVHPDFILANGLVFEISVDNLLNIVKYCNIENGTFTTEMIFAHEGKNLILIPTNSELYKEAVDDTNRAAATKTKSVVKPSDLIIGDIIEFADKRTALYVGKYDGIQFEHVDHRDNNTWRQENFTQVTSKLSKEKRHFYIESYDDRPSLCSVQSLKIFRVKDHIDLTQQRAYERIYKAYRYWATWTPILKDSIFNVEVAKYKSETVNKFYHSYYSYYEIVINEHKVSYKTRYESKVPLINLIWMTLGNSKVCINFDKDSMNLLERQ